MPIKPLLNAPIKTQTRVDNVPFQTVFSLMLVIEVLMGGVTNDEEVLSPNIRDNVQKNSKENTKLKNKKVETTNN